MTNLNAVVVWEPVEVETGTYGRPESTRTLYGAAQALTAPGTPRPSYGQLWPR